MEISRQLASSTFAKGEHPFPHLDDVRTTDVRVIGNTERIGNLSEAYARGDLIDLDEEMQTPAGKMTLWLEEETHGMKWLRRDRICFVDAQEAKAFAQRFAGDE